MALKETIKEEQHKIEREIRERVTSYIIGSFGFVAGIAWNEAIQALIAELFALRRDSVIAKFIYAVVITVILVLVSIYVMRLFVDKRQADTKPTDEKRT